MHRSISLDSQRQPHPVFNQAWSESPGLALDSSVRSRVLPLHAHTFSHLPAGKCPGPWAPLAGMLGFGVSPGLNSIAKFP